MSFWGMCGIVLASVQYLKKRFNLKGKPVIALGIIGGFIGSFIFGNFIASWDVWQCILGGLLVGATSGGAYDFVKKMVEFLSDLIKQKP